MIIRHKDSNVLEVTIQDTIYIGNHNPIYNFNQYLQTKQMEFEQALTKTLHTMPGLSFGEGLEENFKNNPDKLILETNQRKPDLD